MRIILTLITMLFICSLNAQVSTAVKQDTQGNYVEMKTIKAQATEASLTAKAQKTSATFTDQQGTKFPVYLSASGKAFIVRKAKTSGNFYRCYLKNEATVGTN